MAKVSVALRGWRFDEADVLDDEGGIRPLDEMPAETRRRLLRLVHLVDRECHVCRLRRDAAERRRATVVYGEPDHEVVCCDDHERDFVYWYREAGGRRHRGDPDLRDAFHAWIERGNRAPEEYDGVDHVDTAPEHVPALDDLRDRLAEGLTTVAVDVRDAADTTAEDEGG